MSALASALREVLSADKHSDDTSQDYAELRNFLLRATNESAMRVACILKAPTFNTEVDGEKGTSSEDKNKESIERDKLIVIHEMKQRSHFSGLSADEVVEREAAEIKAKILGRPPPKFPPHQPTAPFNQGQKVTAANTSRVNSAKEKKFIEGDEEENSFLERVGKDLLTPLRSILTEGAQSLDKDDLTPPPTQPLSLKVPVPLDPNAYKSSSVAREIHGMLTPKERALSAALLAKYADIDRPLELVLEDSSVIGDPPLGGEQTTANMNVEQQQQQQPLKFPSRLPVVKFRHQIESGARSSARRTPPPPSPLLEVRGTKKFDLLDDEEDPFTSQRSPSIPERPKGSAPTAKRITTNKALPPSLKPLLLPPTLPKSPPAIAIGQGIPVKGKRVVPGHATRFNGKSVSTAPPPGSSPAPLSGFKESCKLETL